MLRSRRRSSPVIGSRKVSSLVEVEPITSSLPSGVRTRWCGSRPVGRRSTSFMVWRSTTLSEASSELRTMTRWALARVGAVTMAARIRLKTATHRLDDRLLIERAVHSAYGSDSPDTKMSGYISFSPAARQWSAGLESHLDAFFRQLWRGRHSRTHEI